MRRMIFLLVTAAPLLQGCNLTRLILYNAGNEPVNYVDQQHVAKRAEKMAREAWWDHVAAQESCPPPAYEEGYISGFTDYLLKGGNGSPPAFPPAHLRRLRNLNPEGFDEIDSYYQGFAAGAADAQASGLRKFYTIPISTPLPETDDPSHLPDSWGEKGKETPMDPAADPTEVLPPPQKPADAPKMSWQMKRPKPQQPTPEVVAPPVLEPETIVGDSRSSRIIEPVGSSTKARTAIRHAAHRHYDGTTA